MNIFKIVKIIIEDKKYKENGYNKRVNEINSTLKLYRTYNTKPFIIDGEKYIVEYSKGRFWYDNERITLKKIIYKFSYWHVHHWLVYPSGGKCGFGTSIVSGYFSKKNIYKFLEQESKRIDNIVNKLNAVKT